MKACLIDANHNPYLSDVAEPQLRSDEVLIDIHCAGVNRADLLQRAGTYPSPEGCPPWMGLEVSGVITEVGVGAAEKSSFKIGDKVCALLGGGGYAERIAVKYDMLLPVPFGFSFEEAAAIPENYATSYLNLVREGDLKRGETFLVFAGASGIGISSIQIAKSLGARVIATVRSDGKAEAISQLGADLIVNTNSCDIHEVFASEGVDVVLDCVGGNQLGECLALMNRYGRWVMIATLGGVKAEINLRALLTKGICLKGSTLRSRTPEAKADILASLKRDLYPAFERGDIKPVIFGVYDFDRVSEAQDILIKNKNIGKVILKMK